MIQLSKPSDNMGGLLNLWAVPTSDFYVNGQNIVFSSTDNICQLYCSAESLAYKEASKRTRAGMHYNCSVSAFIPKDTQEIQRVLNKMEYRLYVVVFQDGNGNYKLSGSSFYPLRLSASLETGKQTSDRAGYKIEFSGETISRAIFINNPF